MIHGVVGDTEELYRTSVERDRGRGEQGRGEEEREGETQNRDRHGTDRREEVLAHRARAGFTEEELQLGKKREKRDGTGDRKEEYSRWRKARGKWGTLGGPRPGMRRDLQQHLHFHHPPPECEVPEPWHTAVKRWAPWL